jgi:hypothetical protein
MESPIESSLRPIELPTERAVRSSSRVRCALVRGVRAGLRLADRVRARARARVRVRVRVRVWVRVRARARA